MRLRSRKTWFSLGGVLIVVIVIVVAVVGSAPSHGTVTISKATEYRQRPPRGELSGTYFRLTYPAIFGGVAKVGDSTALEQYRFVGTTPAATSLAVTIHKLPSGQLTDDSSYRVRVLQPQLYTEQTIKVPAGDAHVLTRTDGSEVTVFLAHGSVDATIAVTGSQNSPTISAVTTNLANRFSWSK